VAAAALAYSGAAAALRWARKRRGDHRLYILAYHDVAREHEPEGTVSAARFRSHVRYLKQRFQVLPITDAVERLEQDEPLDRDYAVVTLDDGYLGNYEHAFPVLSEERVPATVFVTTGFLDGAPLWFDSARRCLADAAAYADRLPDELRDRLRATFGQWPPAAEDGDPAETLKRLPGRDRDLLVGALVRAAAPISPSLRPLTWEQVRRMAAGGVEIGCHTVSHPILSSLGAEEQRSEVVRARDRIAEETGRTPRFFAYPNGSAADFTAETMRILDECGFRAACSTIRGPNTPGCDLFQLKRIGIGADPEFVLDARFCGLFDDPMRRRMGWTRSAPLRGAAEASI
jgi:peptidoglycan/xylan/chitin deacetylase (PgdA/CDA1 family)